MGNIVFEEETPSIGANVRGLPQGWYFITVRPATEAD